MPILLGKTLGTIIATIKGRTAEMRGLTVLVIMATSALALPVDASAGTPVKPDQLVKLFANGKPFKAFAGQDILMKLNANGTGEYILVSSNKKETGTWRITGSEYCSKWGDRPERCFTAEKDGARYNLAEGGKAAGWWQR